MFGMYGALFVLTQYLQFSLGYTALQTGIRVLPAAAAVALVAHGLPVPRPRSSGQFTTAGGLLIVAAGLWQISGASITSTYARQPARDDHAGRRGRADHPLHDRLGHGLAAARGHRRGFRHQRNLHAGGRGARGGRDRQPPRPPGTPGG